VFQRGPFRVGRVLGYRVRVILPAHVLVERPPGPVGQGDDGVVEAEHLCTTLRGVQAVGSTTVTSTLLGDLREDARSRAEFFTLAGVGNR
jgi:hypothetical protein